ncbi:MAG: alanine racemase [Solirubrobacteraceae bacterium]|nr:alanine racemase [Solirubrobacteraceae bacterium]
MPDAPVTAPSRDAGSLERVWAEVDGAAISANVRRMSGAAPRSACCAVVKADGYGHGAVPAARASLEGGATWLAVVTASEAEELRAAGIDARLLVLGPLTADELPRALACDADIVAWTPEVLDRAAALGGARVHVKLDTGMGRLGARSPELATALVRRCAEDPGLTLAGAMTHFATADELGDRYFAEQLAAFTDWVPVVREHAPEAVIHAANSAAILRDEATHFDLVRPGIAIYGMDPFGANPDSRELAPALSLRAALGAVQPIRAGQSTGYGRRWVAERDGWIGIVPIGYGDGWRRGLTNAADAIVDGRRCALVGTVSMDSVAVDLGEEPVAAGTPVTLIGTDGDERITAEDLARALGTINYEITCGLGPRIPRR